jgi:hypothetical protein
MNDASPLVKLIALAIVGGVAKSLFGPPAVYNVTNLAETAKDVAEAVKR